MPGNGLSFSRILSGLSKSINIANEIIPLYQKISPTIGNIYNIVNKVKIVKNSSNSVKSNKKAITLNSNSFNNPTFFI